MIFAEATAIGIAVIIAITAVFDAMGKLSSGRAPTLLRTRGDASVHPAA
mgnify:CR=1 FL=1